MEKSEAEAQKSQSDKWQCVASVKAAGNSNATKNYSFIDKNVTVGKYSYRLKMVDNDGTFKYSSIVEANVSAPNKFLLGQNYPIPFNPSIVINLQLPEAGM